MTNQDLLAKTQALIALKSTAENPAKLREAYDFVLQFVRSFSKQITIEEFERNGKPSFLAYKGKSRPKHFHVLLNGHVDVVPGKAKQFKPVIKDGKLYGRGAYDMKAAVIIFADVFCDFVDKLPYDLGLQIVSDEELGGYDGTYHQIEQGVHADFVIAGECGRAPDKNEIVNEAKGLVFADIELTGKTAHGAYPWKGENAAMRAVHFAQALHDKYPTPTEEWPSTTATVTTIDATAGVHNQVPTHALLKVDCRFTVDDPHFQSEQHFVDLIKSISPDAKIKFHVFSPPMYADPKGTFMQKLKRAAESVEGHKFVFALRHAGSDARHYTSGGSQACEFGIAGEHQHGDDEYIPVKAFEQYRETLRSFLASGI